MKGKIGKTSGTSLVKVAILNSNERKNLLIT